MSFTKNMDEARSNNGARFNWNVFPSTRLEASRLVTPLGCLYKPLHRPHDPIPQTSQLPITCNSCRNYINPHIKIDKKNKMWWCPFCQKRSYLPLQYPIPDTSIDEDWPIELRQTSTTLDYELPNDVSESIDADTPFAYIFIVDKHQHIDDIQDNPFGNLVQNLIAVAQKIPDGALVGLITYDESVCLHKFGLAPVTYTSEMITDPKKTEKQRYKELFGKQAVGNVASIAGLPYLSSLPNRWTDSPLVAQDILLEITPSTRSLLINELQGLKPKLTPTYRPQRSTGLANYVSTILLSSFTYRNYMGKTMFFNSGPATSFPGLIVEDTAPIRSHTDIVELTAANFKPALKFYKCLALIAAGQTIENSCSISNSTSVKTTSHGISHTSPSWIIDIYIGSLDQVGLYEMKSLANNTMGSILLMDSFGSYQLDQVILRAIEPPQSVLNQLTVATSQDLKVSRLVGDVGYAMPSSYTQSSKYHDEHHAKISDTITKFDSPLTKKTFTNQWRFNGLNDDVSLAILFEMNSARSWSELGKNSPKEVYIQFQLKYWDMETKRWKLRVTTAKKPTTYGAILQVQDNQTSHKILSHHLMSVGFDQTAWLVILSRLLIQKIDTTLGFDKFDDLIPLIDDSLVKLLYHFGGLKLDINGADASNPYASIQQSYVINEHLRELPSWCYNLRRNPMLLKIFNSSPDEIAFYHAAYLTMDCELSLNVIEPALYEIGTQVQRVSLDSSSLHPSDSFLVMDSVFKVIIYKQNGGLQLHLSNNDEYFKQNRPEISGPMAFVEQVGRNIVPKYVLTQLNHSQLRFLISRLSPQGKDEPEQPQAPKNEPKGGLWGLFKSKPAQAPQYSKLYTDDLSLKQYYDELVRLVGAYTIQGDY